jgi:hypothetical protein
MCFLVIHFQIGEMNLRSFKTIKFAVFEGIRIERKLDNRYVSRSRDIRH